MLQSSLLFAAQRGDLKTVTEFFERNQSLNINQRLKNGGTALLLAASKGHVEVMAYLLERKANPNTPSFGLASPLERAVSSSSLAGVELLLKHKADASEGQNPFFTLATTGRVDIAEVLHRHKIVIPDRVCDTGLVYAAAANGHADLCRWLVAHLGDPKLVAKAEANKHVPSAFNIAKLNSHSECAAFLQTVCSLVLCLSSLFAM